VPDAASAHSVVGRASLAIDGLRQSRIVIILSGHLHLSHTGLTAERYPTQGHAALLIKAGTATSTRQRGEVNAFNIVRIAKPEADVACMVWHPERMTFSRANVDRFGETQTGWVRLNAT
jgi:hypothetical protein